MLNPPRPLLVWLVVAAAAGLVLGLATDVGLFGWAFAALVAIYLGVVGVTRMTRGTA